jgi:hypothetical protein
VRGRLEGNAMKRRWSDWLSGYGGKPPGEERNPTAPGSSRPGPLEPGDWEPSPAYLRRAERLARSAATPGFAEIRTKAVKTIHAALGDHARPLGYRSARAGWEKPGPLGAARVSIQRGSSGADCAINLDLFSRPGPRRQDPMRLGKFYRPEENDGIEPGWILYLDVAEDPRALDLPLRIFGERALLWLEASRQRGARVALDAYIPDRPDPGTPTGPGL